jgi:acyl-CoA thioester hydrolase
VTAEQAPGARLRIPVQLRWSDMDAYGHINNVEMLRVLEEARIAAFWTHPDPPADGGWPTAVLAAGPGAATEMLVARQEIEYVRPLGYRRTPVVVELWIGHLGGASIDVCYEVLDGDRDAAGSPYARACTTLALVDPATGAPRRVSAAERASWSLCLGPMVTIRRRGSR